MDDLHLILASGRLSSPPRTPTLAAAAVATPPREAQELLLDEARALLAEGAALLVAGPGARSTRHAAPDTDALAQALELFDAAIAMAPSLKSYAVRVGSRSVVSGSVCGPRTGGRGYVRVGEPGIGTTASGRSRAAHPIHTHPHPHSSSAAWRCTT